jgi:hypothetical protein
MFERNHSGVKAAARKQLDAERAYLRQWPELVADLRRRKWDAAARRLREMHTGSKVQ